VIVIMIHSAIIVRIKDDVEQGFFHYPNSGLTLLTK
jgi:hypothetical protein